jgi:hypothetical protein
MHLKSILETEKTLETLSAGPLYKKTGLVFFLTRVFFQPCLQLCDGELGPRVVHVRKHAALQQVRAQVAAARAHPHARQHNVLAAT